MSELADRLSEESGFTTNRQRARKAMAEAAAQLRAMETLLRAAFCPSDCDGGSIPHGPDPDGQWEAEQCQWCYERGQLLPDPPTKAEV